jgi:hypothetical protein
MKLQVGNAGDGALGSFEQLGNRPNDYWRKNSRRKQIWAANRKAIRLLEIERKRDQPRKRKEESYVQKRLGKRQAARPRITRPKG